MIQYNPKKDRSEEFGWKKVCDEYIPSEEEQDRWGVITVIFCISVIVIGFLGSQYGIF
jgi:hypothetical protein